MNLLILLDNQIYFDFGHALLYSDFLIYYGQGQMVGLAHFYRNNHL